MIEFLYATYDVHCQKLPDSLLADPNTLICLYSNSVGLKTFTKIGLNEFKYFKDTGCIVAFFNTDESFLTYIKLLGIPLLTYTNKGLLLKLEILHKANVNSSVALVLDYD